jgi:tRNA (guanine37-N1)-methyltransferase
MISSCHKKTSYLFPTCGFIQQFQESINFVQKYAMRIDILTVKHSILKRAIDNGLVEIHIHNIRDYSTNKQRQVDDYAFGGGAGMVMNIEPIDRLISRLKSERDYDEIIYLSPDGEKFDQNIANRFSIMKNLIFLCGHYKGVDQRVRDHLITKELSIGDYVLTGGEIAATVIVDCTLRLIPGVLSDETSALTDSFQDHLLAPPVYTRPADYKGWKVPEILLSGKHLEIEEWRHEQAIERTKRLRPDLLKDESE